MLWRFSEPFSNSICLLMVFQSKLGAGRSQWVVLGLAWLFGFSESVSATNLILPLVRM